MPLSTEVKIGPASSLRLGVAPGAERKGQRLAESVTILLTTARHHGFHGSENNAIVLMTLDGRLMRCRIQLVSCTDYTEADDSQVRPTMG